MKSVILGISFFYHDSSAALLVDGEIIAAAQEERFTRIKHDSSFPINAIKYVLREWGGDPSQVKLVSYYEKPFLKFERILENVHSYAPSGLSVYLKLVPSWLKDKLNIKKTINHYLKDLGIRKFEIFYPEHHLSHAASAYYPSPYQEAAILTVDGVGEWATTTIMHAKDNKIKKLKEIKYPHSLGLFYSSFTSYCGFRVNDGEYKLMGLAPFSDPKSEAVQNFVNLIKKNIISIYKDGSFTLNLDFFDFSSSSKMYRTNKWRELFGIGPNKNLEYDIDEAYINLCSAVQLITEEVYLKLAFHAKEITGSNNLCLAGGVALNCVANGLLSEKKIFESIWIQPAAGDAGGSVGSALAAHHIGLNSPKNNNQDIMKNSLLGPLYTENEVLDHLREQGAEFEVIENFSSLSRRTAKLIEEGNIIGWFQDRMEYGPRALGNRSILADPRVSDMQSKINHKIKFREGFRPFAPMVLEEDCRDYFENLKDSPYMLLVTKVKKELLNFRGEDFSKLSLKEKVQLKKSSLPAITHVNNTSRVQTISKESNPKCHQLLSDFKELTGTSVLINTSFNENNEPIVCSPQDAYRCFLNTGLDYLVLGNILLKKA
ncbi:MAG: carbamoyltransferase [Bacteriovoracaceae bacterium]|jgi:carbamoyltransferase